MERDLRRPRPGIPELPLADQLVDLEHGRLVRVQVHPHRVLAHDRGQDRLIGHDQIAARHEQTADHPADGRSNLGPVQVELGGLQVRPCLLQGCDGLVLLGLVPVEIDLGHGAGFVLVEPLEPRVVLLGQSEAGLVLRDLGFGGVIRGLVRPRVDLVEQVAFLALSREKGGGGKEWP